MITGPVPVVLPNPNITTYWRTLLMPQILDWMGQRPN